MNHPNMHTYTVLMCSVIKLLFIIYLMNILSNTDHPTVTISPNYNQYNVKENTTNLQLTCTVTDANPAVTSYRWYKGNLLMSNIMSTYTIPTVLRSHTGSYKCDATNSVGSSIPSSALQLNVLCKFQLYPNIY